MLKEAWKLRARRAAQAGRIARSVRRAARRASPLSGAFPLFRYAAGASSEVQFGHRTAALGMEVWQNGHSLLAGSDAAGSRFSRLICFTSRKTAKATIT